MKKRIKCYDDLPQGYSYRITVFSTPLDCLRLSFKTLYTTIFHIFVQEINEEIIFEVERRMKVFLTHYKKFDEYFFNSKNTNEKEELTEENMLTKAMG